MRRQWTPQAVQRWIDRRDDHRKKSPKKLPPMSELRESPNKKDYEAALDVERTNVLEGLNEWTKRTAAWPIQKHPIDIYAAPFSGTLHLPLHLRQSDGKHTLKSSKGDNLNALVYSFYNERAERNYGGMNYVSPDSFTATRNEYLGPSPHVVGFQFVAKTRDASIEWWDPYLNTRWVGTTTWKVEVYFDEAVQGWVSRPRGDFDRSPDMEVYSG